MTTLDYHALLQSFLFAAERHHSLDCACTIQPDDAKTWNISMISMFAAYRPWNLEWRPEPACDLLGIRLSE
jgi:hypothetical protein